MKALWDSVPTRTMVLLLAGAVGWLANDYLGTRASLRDYAHDLGEMQGRVAGWDAIDRTLHSLIERVEGRMDDHIRTTPID